MNIFNWAAILAAMDPNAVFRIFNQARPAQNYLFNRILPERNMVTFDIRTGSMRVVPTMVGHVGMDSPYPPGGLISVREFMEESAKLAQTITLPEKMLRDLYQIVLRLQAGRKPTTQVMLNTIYNFARLQLQAQMDTMEWLRGQALFNFQINWEFTKRPLKVDYKLDANKYMLPQRVGTAGYGGSSSVFWADQALAKSRLKHRLTLAVAHPNTVEMIVNNDANKLRVLSENDGTFQIVRKVGPNEVDDSDARYRVTLVAYGEEGAILDPNDTSKTIPVPFTPEGKILWVGRPGSNPTDFGRAAVGQGPVRQDSLELGYTHMAPTVEGGFADGRWGRVYTPERRPWELVGDSVSNGLPVIEAEDQLVVSRTDMV